MIKPSIPAIPLCASRSILATLLLFGVLATGAYLMPDFLSGSLFIAKLRYWAVYPWVPALALSVFVVSLVSALRLPNLLPKRIGHYIPLGQKTTGQVDQVKLRKFIIDRFSEEGLRTLCFDLSLDYDDLPSSGRANKARELVAKLKRRGRLDQLVGAVLKERPQFADEIFTMMTVYVSDSEPGQQVRKEMTLDEFIQSITGRFDESAFHSLCSKFDLEYDSLEGNGITAKAQGLVAEMLRHDHLDQLVDKVSKERMTTASATTGEPPYTELTTESVSLTSRSTWAYWPFAIGAFVFLGVLYFLPWCISSEDILVSFRVWHEDTLIATFSPQETVAIEPDMQVSLGAEIAPVASEMKLPALSYHWKDASIASDGYFTDSTTGATVNYRTGQDETEDGVSLQLTQIHCPASASYVFFIKKKSQP